MALRCAAVHLRGRALLNIAAVAGHAAILLRLLCVPSCALGHSDVRLEVLLGVQVLLTFEQLLTRRGASAISIIILFANNKWFFLPYLL